MKLPVLLIMGVCCLTLAESKSEPATSRESKHKVSTKHNSLSTTPKPETQYQTIQQQQLVYQQPQYQQQAQYQQQPQYQQQQVQYQQVQYPQEPLRAQLQRALQQHQQQQQQQIVLPQHQVQPVQQLQYQPQVQLQQQPQLAHLVQKAYYVPQQQNQPAAMIIIAQPAYVPAGPGPVHGGPAPQLVNYFQNNPQARYQFLHGNYQPQQVQPAVQQPANTIGNYVVAIPAAHYQPNIVAVPIHRPQLAHLAQPQEAPASPTEATPLQLSEIAQIASQQYTRINPSPQPETSQAEQPQQYHYQSEGRAHPAAAQQQVPVRSLPPIFTGFENFSPEQQEKIKAQLSAHFGAPLQAISADRVPLPQGQDNQYSSKYQPQQSGLNQNEFIPSEQVKTDASSPNVSSNKSTHYTKA